MDYDATFGNWRWWLILPLAVVALPFALIDLFSLHVVRPILSAIVNWVHQRN